MSDEKRDPTAESPAARQTSPIQEALMRAVAEMDAAQAEQNLTDAVMEAEKELLRAQTPDQALAAGEAYAAAKIAAEEAIAMRERFAAIRESPRTREKSWRPVPSATAEAEEATTPPALSAAFEDAPAFLRVGEPFAGRRAKRTFEEEAQQPFAARSGQSVFEDAEEAYPSVSLIRVAFVGAFVAAFWLLLYLQGVSLSTTTIVELAVSVFLGAMARILVDLPSWERS